MRARLSRGLLIGWLALTGQAGAWATEPVRPAASTPCAPDTLARLEEHRLGPPRDRPAALVVASACKRWPFDDSIELAVATYGDAEGVPGERMLYGVVAMLSAADGGVLASHFEEIGEDASTAVQEGAYRLDTARYDLAEGVRAFGVVFTSSAQGANCPEAGANEQLTLYVREGTRLRPVLSTYLDGWATVRGDICGSADERVIDLSHTVLQIEPTRQHGWADITLSTRVERAVGSEAPYYRRTARHTIRYNGTLYQLDPHESLLHWNAEDAEP